MKYFGGVSVPACSRGGNEGMEQTMTTDAEPHVRARDGFPTASADPRAEALDSLLRIAHDLRRHVEAVGREFGLSGPQARLVFSLTDPLRMQAAAEATSCEPSHLSAIADQLTEAGLLAREPDPDDGRARRLTLTASGRALRRRLVPALLADAPVLTDLDDTECHALDDLLRARRGDESG